jgi:heptosyltransferase II
MKLLIEVPTWLGDAIMSTPAIENVVKKFEDIEITIFGSYVSTELFKNHPNVKNIIVDKTKKSKNRYIELFKLARKIGSFDMAISFRSSFTTKLFFFFIHAKKKYIFKKVKEQMHQVIKYNDFINKSLNNNIEAKDLKIHFNPFSFSKPTLGINPGATYGSAKRWYPEEFAKVAISLANKYDIIIFGGPNEVDIANDIEKELISNAITNYQNLAAKTTISELIEKIAGLDLFITNDSGPMHVAAAFKIKTICIFGPTKFTETNQWHNENGRIITKNLDCAPCMKRVCPLKHHNCMKLITASDVLKVVEKLA